MSSESRHIQLLRNRYKDSLAEKADIVGRHLHTLLDMEDPKEDVLMAIRSDLHKFAGSSGMYGYSDIAETAREAMKMVDAVDETQLHCNLIALRNLLRQHAKS